MKELIGGKEALSQVYSGLVQYMHSSETQDRWTTITDNYYPQYHLGMFLDEDSEFKFRLKPRTIMIGNIEVPAPFEPKDGDVVFVLDNANHEGFSSFVFDSDFFTINFGAWRTEGEIKQVVDALRSVFEIK